MGERRRRYSGTRRFKPQRTFLCGLVVLSAASCGRIDFDPTAADAQSPMIDAADPIQQLACVPSVDESLLALYPFDQDVADQVVDLQGANPGILVGTVAHTDGPAAECGQALLFDGDLGNYAQVDDSNSWIVDAGSLDFWFRLDAMPTDYVGLVSKDASGTAESGHITVFIDSQGRLLSRIQETGAPNSEGVTCSAPGAIVVGQWNHLGVNFGTATVTKVWLNGFEIDEPGTFDTLVCQTATEALIDNREPWAFGLAAWNSASGLATPSSGSLVGALDHVRISNAARDFTGPEFYPPRP